MILLKALPNSYMLLDRIKDRERKRESTWGRRGRRREKARERERCVEKRREGREKAAREEEEEKKMREKKVHRKRNQAWAPLGTGWDL